MSHPLIDQLRFTRREWLRGLEGVSDEDAARHFGQMNCISWTVGHLAWHEQRYWLELHKRRSVGQSIGSALHRMIYHYWYHIGEIQAIRQMLGQGNLPEYVGDIEIEAPYRPEG
jgi:hypothetical protein